MTTLKEDLWKTLEDLTDAQFKQFKWFLKENDMPEGFSAIPVAPLESADRQDTVDLMVQKYNCLGALEITIRVLKKISRNDLVQHLSNLKNTDSVLLKYKYEREKSMLGKMETEIKLMIQERQMKILEVKHSAELSKKSAHKQIADSLRVFTVLQQAVERSLANLIDTIEEKQKKTQKLAEGFIQELEQEISELTKRRTEMEKLPSTKDHLDFFQSPLSLNAFPPTKNWTKVGVPPPSYKENVTSTVDQLQENFSKEMKKLLAEAELIRVQQFAVDVTLDSDTANPYLILSDDGKQVYCGDTGVHQNLPDKPERFNPAINVLGKQGFSSGRFYFEVQVKGKTAWDLGVVKQSVIRKGSISAKPDHGYWTICLRNGDKYKASAVSLNVTYQPKKVGVFVDYENCLVSFYDVDAAEHIHLFTDCSFNEKLFPFFSPGVHHGGTNSTPLIISPVNYTV
ncbi:E3 ubiquitin-protein ligase TRIM39-like [Scomber japonicus]|uniref:E3 ubiquitin-protein ligase TRIM39-like n=1 Tax=Scomber japonicus TaxID=13676 RepID=UPI002305E32C|nr:E3 ubiquitin-protein ligase TRIM39-like [Scomber japonicus]